MIELQKSRISSSVDCPYLEGERFRQEYFFAYDLSDEEFQKQLDHGWRRFGTFFFRPACEHCKKCLPIRIPVESFKPSKSQRRNLKKNSLTQMTVMPLQFREEIYQLYLAHRAKFPQDKEEKKDPDDRDHFLKAYYQPAVPCFQTEYYVQGRLAGIGFVDKGSLGLSSVYFAYHPDFSQLGLGTFSVLKEMELAKSWGIQYYYLGYYVEECSRMVYKGRFNPHQLMNWNHMTWG